MDQQKIVGPFVGRGNYWSDTGQDASTFPKLYSAHEPITYEMGDYSHLKMNLSQGALRVTRGTLKSDANVSNFVAPFALIRIAL